MSVRSAGRKRRASASGPSPFADFPWQLPQYVLKSASPLVPDTIASEVCWATTVLAMGIRPDTKRIVAHARYAVVMRNLLPGASFRMEALDAAYQVVALAARENAVGDRVEDLL